MVGKYNLVRAASIAAAFLTIPVAAYAEDAPANSPPVASTTDVQPSADLPPTLAVVPDADTGMCRPDTLPGKMQSGMDLAGTALNFTPVKIPMAVLGIVTDAAGNIIHHRSAGRFIVELTTDSADAAASIFSLGAAGDAAHDIARYGFKHLGVKEDLPAKSALGSLVDDVSCLKTRHERKAAGEAYGPPQQLFVPAPIVNDPPPTETAPVRPNDTVVVQDETMEGGPTGIY